MNNAGTGRSVDCPVPVIRFRADKSVVQRPVFPSRRSAFSLIELVIVVVIMGIVAAIAVPRLSSAADNAASNAVTHDLGALQRAIELYTAGARRGAAPRRRSGL